MAKKQAECQQVGGEGVSAKCQQGPGVYNVQNLRQLKCSCPQRGFSYQ